MKKITPQEMKLVYIKKLYEYLKNSDNDIIVTVNIKTF